VPLHFLFGLRPRRCGLHFRRRRNTAGDGGFLERRARRIANAGYARLFQRRPATLSLASTSLM
jgi:hypothetical protein